jgi:hypothetical protein
MNNENSGMTPDTLNMKTVEKQEMHREFFRESLLEGSYSIYQVGKERIYS